MGLVGYPRFEVSFFGVDVFLLVLALLVFLLVVLVWLLVSNRFLTQFLLTII